MVDWVGGHAPFPTIHMLGNIVIEGEVVVALCLIVGLMLGWYHAHMKAFAMAEQDGKPKRRHKYFNIPVILDMPETLKYTGHLGLLEDAIASIKGLSELADDDKEDHQLHLRLMKDHYRHAEDILFDIGCGLGERSHE